MTCDRKSCPWAATMAVRTVRTVNRSLKTTVFYHPEEAPKTAERLCRQHGRELMNDLIVTLVPGENAP